jgi:hypothetical protein
MASILEKYRSAQEQQQLLNPVSQLMVCMHWVCNPSLLTNQPRYSRTYSKIHDALDIKKLFPRYNFGCHFPIQKGRITKTKFMTNVRILLWFDQSQRIFA